jgi:hypothetical protein
MYNAVTMSNQKEKQKTVSEKKNGEGRKTSGQVQSSQKRNPGAKTKSN